LATPLRKTFGRNFREAREAEHLTQRDVSVRTKVTQGWVSALEGGEVNITIELMALLAHVVRSDVVTLLTPTKPAGHAEERLTA